MSNGTEIYFTDFEGDNIIVSLNFPKSERYSADDAEAGAIYISADHSAVSPAQAREIAEALLGLANKWEDEQPKLSYQDALKLPLGTKLVTSPFVVTRAGIVGTGDPVSEDTFNSYNWKVVD